MDGSVWEGIQSAGEVWRNEWEQWGVQVKCKGMSENVWEFVGVGGECRRSVEE